MRLYDIVHHYFLGGRIQAIMAIKTDCHSLKFAGSLVDALGFQHSLRDLPSCIELISKTLQLAFPVFCMNISSDNKN